MKQALNTLHDSETLHFVSYKDTEGTIACIIIAIEWTLQQEAVKRGVTDLILLLLIC